MTPKQIDLLNKVRRNAYRSLDRQIRSRYDVEFVHGEYIGPGWELANAEYVTKAAEIEATMERLWILADNASRSLEESKGE